MKALILAAGMGVRLGKLTDGRPKALVKVAGKSLVDHVLDFVDHPEVSEVGVVSGFRSDLLEAHLSKKNVTLFKNENYRLGNIFSVISALEFMDNDFLLLNVDHIYPKKLLDYLLKHLRGISAMCDTERHLEGDDMKVKFDGNGRLKKISKELGDYDAGYIGMTFCSKDMNDVYKRGVEDTLQIYGKNSCAEFVLGHIAANETNINICNTDGFKWLEIDTEEDIANAERILKGRKYD